LEKNPVSLTVIGYWFIVYSSWFDSPIKDEQWALNNKQSTNNNLPTNNKKRESPVLSVGGVAQSIFKQLSF
jgi:hypothetical protein